MTPWKNLGIHVKDVDINIVAAPARTLYGTRPSLRYLCVLPAVSAAGGGFRRRRGALRAGMCTLLRYPSRTAETTTIIIFTTCCAHRYIFQVRLFRVLIYCTDHSTRNSGKLGSFPQFFSHRFYEFQRHGEIGRSARPAGPGGAALQPLEQLVCHTFPSSSKCLCSALHVMSAGVPAVRGGDRARCSLHVAPRTVTVCMSRPLLTSECCRPSSLCS